jgi:hypothetical protein
LVWFAEPSGLQQGNSWQAECRVLREGKIGNYGFQIRSVFLVHPVWLRTMQFLDC